MRLILALGAAMAATTMMAHAQSEERNHIIVRHGGPGADADGDGWITRAEASAAADRLFAELDRNGDGRLDRSDRPQIEHSGHRGGGHPAPDADNCTRTESNEAGERRVTVICRTERQEGGDSRRDERREVIIRRHGNGEGVPLAPMAPHPPMAPHAPMFMMFLGEDSEADLDSDGAISRDEFRAQHLRMFDAHDANGDGRIRAPRMPTPPAPPTPPSPPR